VTIGDFNGDGIPDLAIASVYPSAVSVMLGMATALFRLPGFWRRRRSDRGVAADFNLDGKMDIASTNSAFNDVRVMLNSCPVF